MELTWALLPISVLIVAIAAEPIPDASQAPILEKPQTSISEKPQAPIFEPKACKWLKRVRCSKYRIPEDKVECPCGEQNGPCHTMLCRLGGKVLLFCLLLSDSLGGDH